MRQKHVEFIASAFSSNGVGVLVCADHPTQRHDTKRESIRRTCEKERIAAPLLEKRTKLSSLLQNSKTSRVESRDALSKEARSLEHKVRRSLLESFVDYLTSMMCSKTHEKDQDSNFMHVVLKIASNQADPNIAKCVVDGEANAVMSGDSDFSMCLGSNCDYFDMMTKDTTIDKKA